MDMFCQEWATRHKQTHGFFLPAFTIAIFVDFHEFSFHATLLEVNLETIFEAKASKECQETRWMICIHLLPLSYEICKGFFCFLEKSK